MKVLSLVLIVGWLLLFNFHFGMGTISNDSYSVDTSGVTIDDLLDVDNEITGEANPKPMLLKSDLTLSAPMNATLQPEVEPVTLKPHVHNPNQPISLNSSGFLSLLLPTGLPLKDALACEKKLLDGFFKLIEAQEHQNLWEKVHSTLNDKHLDTMFEDPEEKWLQGKLADGLEIAKDFFICTLEIDITQCSKSEKFAQAMFTCEYLKNMLTYTREAEINTVGNILGYLENCLPEIDYIGSCSKTRMDLPDDPLLFCRGTLKNVTKCVGQIEVETVSASTNTSCQLEHVAAFLEILNKLNTWMGKNCPQLPLTTTTTPLAVDNVVDAGDNATSSSAAADLGDEQDGMESNETTTVGDVKIHEGGMMEQGVEEVEGSGSTITFLAHGIVSTIFYLALIANFDW